MAFDGDSHTLSVEEAHALPEREFRQLFVRVVIELAGELGETFTKRVDFLDGRRVENLTTREMQQIVLRYQQWFNPRTAKRLAANDV